MKTFQKNSIQFTIRKKKPLYFEENKHKFANLDKIIHVVVDDLPYTDAQTEYDKAKGNEIFQRECMLRGLHSANPDDIIIITDVDEIVDDYNYAHDELKADIEYYQSRLDDSEDFTPRFYRDVEDYIESISRRVESFIESNE